MAQVEQAVYTSAQTDRAAGYQIVAKSPGITDEDIRELSAWGPSHDSLLDLNADAVSINYHPLPSGAYCVSRTTPAGWEYSGRGGHRVYTQCLIVPPDVLERFGNNPFSLVRAAMASGMLEAFDDVPSRLDPLLIAGGAAPVDSALLTRLAANPGADRLATLVQAALESKCLAVAGQPSPADLIAGLIACLPLQCRRDMFFSTGLKYSSRRPFRIVALTGDKAEQRWVAHQDVTVLDLSDEKDSSTTLTDGWARLIQRVLGAGRISFLSTQLSKRRFELDFEDLPALGLQLLEDFEATALQSEQRRGDASPGGGPPVPVSREVLAAQANNGPGDYADGTSANQMPADEGVQRAHAPHRQFERSRESADQDRVKAVGPSKTLAQASPEMLERLELLDDLVYDAISGSAMAMTRLEHIWPELLTELGDDMVAESREHYLRYALSIWEERGGPNNIRRSTRAVQALDVLCLLFSES